MTFQKWNQWGITLLKKAILADASIQQWHHVAVRSYGRNRGSGSQCTDPGFSAVCCRCQRAFFIGGVLDGSGDMKERLERMILDF